MHTLIRISGAFLLLGSIFIVPDASLAQSVINVDVHSLLQKATVSFSPRTGSFTEGSTFQVPIILNTQGKSINAIEVHIKFNPNRLQVVTPVGQRSIVGLWVEPPTYSNTLGTLTFVGTIPGGITTESGLIANITFKGITPGDTRLSITSGSQILANDGLGTPVVANFGDALYSITIQPPEGPNVFSETNPYSDQWYNNNSPVINWDMDPNITDYSYVVDDQPFTIPSNTANTTDNRISLSDLPNGISYFHIKGRKGKVWGGTTHFTLRIDTLVPAVFTPTYEKLSSGGTLLSFFTTDTLSGIDHYEVGVLDMEAPPDTVPIFQETQSPYQLPTKISGNVRVIVRAIDVAGNVRDAQLEVSGFSYLGMLRDNIATVVSILLFIITLSVIILHFLFVRRVSRALSRTMSVRQNISGPQYHELPPPQEAIRDTPRKRPANLEILLSQAPSSQDPVYSINQDTFLTSHR